MGYNQGGAQIADQYILQEHSYFGVCLDGQEVLNFGVDALAISLDSASSFVLYLLEAAFLSRGIWLKTTYTSVESFLMVTSQAGFLLATATIPFGV